MDPAVNTVLGMIWLLLGGAAVLIMLRIYGKAIPTGGRVRLQKIHVLCGRLFTLIYLYLLVVMVIKVLDIPKLSPLQAVHMALGVMILPLLITKILIVRFFRKMRNILPTLGIGIYALAVVVIAMGTMRFLIGEFTKPDVEGASPEQLVQLGEELLPQRCQKCHDLDRVYDQKGRKSAELWESTMGRMVKLEPSLADVKDPILAYLQAEFTAPAGPEGVMLSGAALVEARCSKCHSLDRVYGPTKTEEGWRATIQRYAELLPDHIRAEEIEPIVAFLFEKRGREPDPEEAKRKLFEQHCGRCHNLSRALDTARESKISSKRWGRVIKRMKGIAGERELGELWTDEEAKTIAEYLVAQYQDEEEAEEDK